MRLALRICSLKTADELTQGENGRARNTTGQSNNKDRNLSSGGLSFFERVKLTEHDAGKGVAVLRKRVAPGAMQGLLQPCSMRHAAMQLKCS